MANLPSVPLQTPPPQYPVVSNRYIDAYRKANFQTSLGASIKTISLIIGGIVAGIFFLVLVNSAQPGMFGPNAIGMGLAFFGIIIGVVIGGLGWIFGSMIASQGQVLKAILDTAVHTSPFLSDVDRARMMSL